MSRRMRHDPRRHVSGHVYRSDLPGGEGGAERTPRRSLAAVSERLLTFKGTLSAFVPDRSEGIACITVRLLSLIAI